MSVSAQLANCERARCGYATTAPTAAATPPRLGCSPAAQQGHHSAGSAAVVDGRGFGTAQSLLTLPPSGG